MTSSLFASSLDKEAALMRNTSVGMPQDERFCGHLLCEDEPTGRKTHSSYSANAHSFASIRDRRSHGGAAGST